MYANGLMGRQAPRCTGTRTFQKNVLTQQSSLVGLVEDANAKRTPSKAPKTRFFPKEEQPQCEYEHEALMKHA